MKIAIVGSGVVGRTTGQGLCAQGHDVVYCDVLASRRAQLSNEGLPVAASAVEAIHCDVYMICVPTPANGEGFDLNYVFAAVDDVGAVLMGHRFVTVAVRSTLLPGTMRGMVLPALETRSGLRAGEHFGLCYNPEFLRAASALDDFTHPPLTVVGEFDVRSARLVADLYQPFNAPVLTTTPENAEAIKCFSNAFNATKISFFNLLFLAGMRAGLDSNVVADGIALATTAIRFPRYGTPGGRPFGGACLPKDLAACVSYLGQLGVDASLLSAATEINRLMNDEFGSTLRKVR